METRYVFVVTGRQLVNGVPRGAIETVVVCSEGVEGVRRYLAKQRPEFGVTTVTGLSALQARVKKIRETLLREDVEWGVLVDPVLMEKEP